MLSKKLYLFFEIKLGDKLQDTISSFLWLKNIFLITLLTKASTTPGSSTPVTPVFNPTNDDDMYSMKLL